MKKSPMRKCLGCQESKPKKELCRIVKTQNGEIIIDDTGKLEGRGAYICYNEECLDKAIKQKRIQREFEIQINNTVYDSLRDKIKNGK